MRRLKKMSKNTYFRGGGFLAKFVHGNFLANYGSNNEGPEGVKWELGLTYFLAGKMGLWLLGMGFCHWEWEMKSFKMEMGLKYSELISNFFHLSKSNVDDSLSFLLLHYIDSVTCKQAYAGTLICGFLLK